MSASFSFTASPQQQDNGQWSIRLSDEAIEWCVRQPLPIVLRWPNGHLDRLTAAEKTVPCPNDGYYNRVNTVEVKLQATHPVNLAKLPSALAVALAADNQSYLHFSLLSPRQQNEAADEIANAKRPLEQQKRVLQLLKRLHRA